MSAATTRDPRQPFRLLALSVIDRALKDHHWRWFFGEWEPTCFRPDGLGTVGLWCDMAELDLRVLTARAEFLREEWLWDLAARAIRKDMEERA